jgi:hypothetical protein
MRMFIERPRPTDAELAALREFITDKSASAERNVITTLIGYMRRVADIPVELTINDAGTVYRIDPVRPDVAEVIEIAAIAVGLPSDAITEPIPLGPVGSLRRRTDRVRA